MCEVFKGSECPFSCSYKDVTISGETIVYAQSKRETGDRVSV